MSTQSTCKTYCLGKQLLLLANIWPNLWPQSGNHYYKLINLSCLELWKIRENCCHILWTNKERNVPNAQYQNVAGRLPKNSRDRRL